VSFVRVSRLAVGGDFDSSGGEEVVVDLEIDGATSTLLRRDLDLPDDSLGFYEFEESEWVELPEVAEVALGLAVVEADVTENESMCGTNGPVVVRPTAVGPTGSSIDVPLSTIRGESSGLFQATKRFVIEEPNLELRLTRVARRDAPDAEGRRLVAGAFAGLDEARPPAADQVKALHELASGWSLAADRVGARSTHTWARRTLAALEDEADALLALLLAAEPVAPSELEQGREALSDAARAMPAADKAAKAVAEQLLAIAGEASPRSARALEALAARLDATGEALEELDPSEARETALGALHAYRMAVDQTLESAEAFAKVGPALEALQAHVAAASGR